MRLVIDTNIISPHQIPLARQVALSLGPEEFRYVYREDVGKRALEWTTVGDRCWLSRDISFCETSSNLLSGLRKADLFKYRAAKGLQTLYMSERWFKPPFGMLRLLDPRYLRMAWQIARLIKTAQKFVYLPIGVYAAADMARLCGLFSGDLRCLFRAPKLEFDRVPGGKIHLEPFDHPKSRGVPEEPKDGQIGWSKQEIRYGLDKMRLWGYFVEPSSWSNEKLKELRSRQRAEVTSGKRPLRILWVGHMMGWKCPDTLIESLKHLNKNGIRVALTLVGYGVCPNKGKLIQMAKGHPEIIFREQVTTEQVHGLMREHDLYVLSSNGEEGWGAVVSEALVERMPIIGTYEAGASRTLLPADRLFHAGDVQELVNLLTRDVTFILRHEDPDRWFSKSGADALLNLLD